MIRDSHCVQTRVNNARTIAAHNVKISHTPTHIAHTMYAAARLLP